MENKNKCVYLRHRWYCFWLDKWLPDSDDKFCETCETCPQHEKHEKRVRVTRNGTDIHRFETRYDVDTWIEELLTENSELNPVKVFDGHTMKDGRVLQVVIFRYNTLYQEVFTIERASE